MVIELRLCNVEKFSYCGAACPCPPGRGTTGQHDRNCGAARLPSWSWHDRPTWQELWCCTPALLVVAWQATWQELWCCTPALLVVARQANMTGTVVLHACTSGRGTKGQHDRNCGAARLPSWSWHDRPTWQEMWCCTPALLVVAWQAHMTGIVVLHTCLAGWTNQEDFDDWIVSLS